MFHFHICVSWVPIYAGHLGFQRFQDPPTELMREMWKVSVSYNIEINLKYQIYSVNIIKNMLFIILLSDEKSITFKSKIINKSGSEYVSDLFKVKYFNDYNKFHCVIFIRDCKLRQNFLKRKKVWFIDKWNWHYLNHILLSNKINWHGMFVRHERRMEANGWMRPLRMIYGCAKQPLIK